MNPAPKPRMVGMLVPASGSSPEGVAVVYAIGLPVEVAILVALPVGVGVGVDVAEPVAVAVAVGVAVALAVDVAVGVGVPKYPQKQSGSSGQSFSRQTFVSRSIQFSPGGQVTV